MPLTSGPSVQDRPAPLLSPGGQRRLVAGETEVGDAPGTQAARLQSSGLARVAGEDLLIDQLRRERKQLRAGPHDSVQPVEGMHRNAVAEVRRYAAALGNPDPNLLAPPCRVDNGPDLPARQQRSPLLSSDAGPQLHFLQGGLALGIKLLLPHKLLQDPAFSKRRPAPGFFVSAPCPKPAGRYLLLQLLSLGFVAPPLGPAGRHSVIQTTPVSRFGKRSTR